jgi:hypothetical protein
MKLKVFFPLNAAISGSGAANEADPQSTTAASRDCKAYIVAVNE